MKKLEDAFKGGTATAETLSKQLGGAQKALAGFIKENTGALGPGQGQGFLGSQQELERLQGRVDAIRANVRELKTLETVGKAH